MKKQVADLMHSYLRKLSDDDRSFLQLRFRERMCGDMGEAVAFLQRNSEMDRWLSTASTANDLYDMVDTVAQYLECVPVHA